METTMEIADPAPLLPDTTEQLSDLVPYRCPKCGHQRKFATLRELRLHLQHDHAFHLGCIKPNQHPGRGNVCHTDSRKPSNVKPQNNLNRDFGKFKANWPSKPSSECSNQFQSDNLNTRDDSPLLESFKADAEKLERELQMAKQNELKNKTKAINNLVSKTVNDTLANGNANEDFRHVIRDMNTTNDHEHSIKHPAPSMVNDNFTDRNVNEDFKRVLDDMRTSNTHGLGYSQIKRPAAPTSGFDVKGALAALNSEVMRSRVNLWETSDELYRSQDVLHGMEHAAEETCNQQRDIIHNLLTEMQLKDRRLRDTDREHRQLSEERSRLFEETETIVREADGHNQRLQEELRRRGDAIEEVSAQMEQLRRQSELELQSKDKDLQNVKEKLGRLEWERERMLGEMEKLLQKADSDSRELRRTVQEKEKQLHKVNAELNDIRSSQQTMLEKTMSVYRKAEEGQEMMKTVVVAKDDQLRAALDRIEQMKGMQQQLVQESRNLTDQSDENTTSLKRMLKMKEDQVTEAMKQLQFLQKEKAQLEDSSSSLAEKASASVAAVKNMKTIVRQRENDLKLAKSELHDLKSNLHSVAEKERAARAKLERFIEDLIDRAEKAETELHALRSQSSNTSEPRKAENVTQAERNYCLMHSADFSADEVTERVSLPKMIPPPKPPRMNTKSRNTIEKRTPEWRQHLNTEQIDPTDTKVSLATPDQVDSKRPPLPPTSHRPEKRIDKKTQQKIVHDDQSEANSLGTYYHELPEECDLRRNKSNSLNIKDVRAPSRKLSKNKAQPSDATEYSPAIDIAQMHPRDKRVVRNHGQSRNNDTQKGSHDKDKEIEQVLEELNIIPTPPKTKHKYGISRSQASKTRLSDSSIHDSNQCPGVSAPGYGNPDSNEKHRPNRHTHRHCNPKEANYPISDKKHQTTGKYIDQQEEKKIESPESKYRKHSGQSKQYIDRTNDSDGFYKPKLNSRKLRYINPTENNALELLNTIDDDEFIYIPKPRPGTIGMSRDSPKHIQTSNQQKTQPRHKQKLKNPEFDSNYPSAHRSTGNLQEGESRRHRSKRSKSHSPAGRDAGNQLSSKHDSDNERSQPVPQQSRFPIQTFKGFDVSDADVSLSDDYDELRDDEDEVEDSDPDKFDQIMDENGILWEDDTLPDVSDSEFDRVSPSGSEAIATKKLCTTGVKLIYSSTRKQSNDIDSDGERPILSNHSPPDSSSNRNVSKGSEDKSIKTKTLASSRTMVKPLKVVKQSSIDCQEPNCKLNPKNEIYSMSKTFRPIKPEPRYSSSDKEMTSGAREVNMHMRRSPSIHVRGSTESLSHSLSSQIVDSANRSSAANKILLYRRIHGTDESIEPTSAIKQSISIDTKLKAQHETFDQTLERVTAKYKSKRDDDIDTKINSIAAKYAKRRQAIVNAEGLPHHTSTLLSNTRHSGNSMDVRKEFATGNYNNTLSFPDNADNTHNTVKHQHYPKPYSSSKHASPSLQGLLDTESLRVSDPNYPPLEGHIPYNQIHGMAVPTYPAMLPGYVNPGIVPGSMYPGRMPGPMHFPVPPYHTISETQPPRGHAQRTQPDHQHYRRTTEFPYIFPYFHGYSPEVHPIPDYVDYTVETGNTSSRSGHIPESGTNATCVKAIEEEIMKGQKHTGEANVVADKQDVDNVSHSSGLIIGGPHDSMSTTNDAGIEKGNGNKTFNRIDKVTKVKHASVANSSPCLRNEPTVAKTIYSISPVNVAQSRKKNGDDSVYDMSKNDNNSHSSSCMTQSVSGTNTSANQKEESQYEMLEPYSEGDRVQRDIETGRVGSDIEPEHINTQIKLDRVEADAESEPIETRNNDSVHISEHTEPDHVGTNIKQHRVAIDRIETENDSGHLGRGFKSHHVGTDIKPDRVEIKSDCVHPGVVSDNAETEDRSSPFEQIDLYDYPIPKTSTNQDGIKLDIDRYTAKEDLLPEAISPEINAALQADIEEIDGLVLAADIKTGVDTEYSEDFSEMTEHKLQTDSLNSVSEGFSMFAEPIIDHEDASYDAVSNTQSMPDISENFSISGELEQDTDTEMVRQEFYEKAQQINDMLESPHSDYSEVYKMNSTRKTLSSASSQASFDILERIPRWRREEVKGRRQVLRCIFSHLDTPTLCRATQVCREWRIVSKSPKLWRRLELRKEKISPKFLLYVARRCSELRVLVLEDIRPRSRKKTETVEEYQENIQSSLEKGCEQILKRSESTLHTIYIVNCGTLLSSKCLWAASCYSRMLRHVTYLSDFDPINAEVMWALGSGCRDLKTLRVHPLNPCQRPNNFSTRCVQLIGKCFTDLETLSLGNADVDIKSLVFIAKQCRKLKVLDLDHMSFVPADVIAEMCEGGLRYLTCIRFLGTPVAPDGLITLQENCHYLDSIHVQMIVNDYFKGTKQKEDLKLYTAEMNKLEELQKMPALANVLKLRTSQVLISEGEEEPANEEDSSPVTNFFKKILPF